MSGMFSDNQTTLRHKSVEWYTPAWVFEELAINFDLDPASPHDHETHVPAAIKYTRFDNGLQKPWAGRVFMNPPYGREIAAWMDRMVDHGHGIVLVFSRTDAAWFQRAFSAADAVLFLAGRIEFVPGHENKHKVSKCGAGTAMLAFGSDCAVALKRLAGRGVFVSKGQLQ